MKDIKPEPFGRCAADRCPGRCPYRDPELMTPEGRSKLKAGNVQKVLEKYRR